MMEFTTDEIAETYKKIQDSLQKTPLWEWKGIEKEKFFTREERIFFKLEFMQYSGSFKPRGILSFLLENQDKAHKNGILAVSAGNHACAVAYVAKTQNLKAKILLPKSAVSYRKKYCEDLGAELIFTDDLASAMEKAKEIEEKEQSLFIHPYEGPYIARGTATLGYEMIHQLKENFDCLLVAVGGGGLAAGVSMMIKQESPKTAIFGVEPEGANSMYMSFKEEKPHTLKKINTIADTLAAPYAMPYSYTLCKKNIHEIFQVTDNEICDAMTILFEKLKFVVEPSGAAAFAAALKYRDQLKQYKKKGIILCGSNLDIKTFSNYTEKKRSGQK